MEKNRAPAVVLNSDEQRDAWLRSIPRPLVFTNGCFDILHRGHIDYLQRASELGMTLLVALNSDASVKRLGKSADRPINSLEDRQAVISALACIDAVCAFDTDTPLELIMESRPEVLVKGGDWPVEQIVGCKQVQSWGGQCHSIGFAFERSTTALLDKIRQTEK